jgi:protein-tyrosine kinase
MSLIEQATRRLEELKRAGIEVPTWDTGVATKEEERAAEPPRVEPKARPSAPPRAALRPLSPATGNALVQVGQRQSRSVQIDLGALADAGYLVPGSPRSTLADEFRAIKQPLLKNARSDADAPIRLGNLIMISSALAGEGKTFCALNLALSIASEVDHSVLLVDADVVRPALVERLGLSGQYKGLLDLLTDARLDLSEVILKTNVPKLSVLPAGTPRINSTELLGSNSMHELLQDIANRYADRIVIFDAPPLLATTESKVLAERMGQLLMVVNEGITPKADIAQAFTTVQACPIVLALLNRSTHSVERQQYGYAGA